MPLQEELQIKFGKMTREQKEVLNRVKLLMGYNSKNTLSENFVNLINEEQPNKVSQEKVNFKINDPNYLDVNYNETVGKASFGNAKIVQDNFDNNTLTQKTLKTFACDILKTDFVTLSMLFEEICRNMRVGPASGDFINYSSSEAINLVSWLVESQLMGNLKFWIGNGTLLETGLNDPISKLIYVKSNPRKKIERVQTGTELPRSKESYKEVPIYKDVQTIAWDKKIYPASDNRFIDYLEKEITLDPSDISVTNEIKNELNKRYKFNEYPNAVRLCSTLGITDKESTEDNLQSDDPEVQKQIDYSFSNNCPTRTLEEENNFRKWVNDNYPKIAQELDLSPSTTEFCTSVVKKAAGHSINRNLVDKYDPTK